MRKLKIAKDGYIAMSVAFYVAGLILILFSDIPPDILRFASGSMLIVYGVIKITGYFSKDLYCLAFQYDFAFGMLIMVLGVLILTLGENMGTHLPLLLGLIILSDSLFKIQMSIDAKRFGLELWGVALTAAIASGACGTLLMISCLVEALAVNIIAGCSILCEGVLNQYIVMRTVKN